MSRRIFFLFLLGNLTFCSQALPQFDGQRAFDYLVKQVDFGPRNPGSKGHEECLNYLKMELEKTADSVILQPFVHYDSINKKTVPLTNIIASYNSKAGKRIFLAAHWDTRPFADMDRKGDKDRPIPGANDGASGVAVLLEIANHLKSNPPEVGVDLILFDGEDYGPEGHLEEYFLGSRYFVKNKGNYRPRYGILLDMIGDANLSLPIEGFSQQSAPHIVDKVWSAAESIGAYQFERRVGQYINDDHVILIEGGIPCIDVIDFEYPDKNHGYWHTREDTPDKCSSESLRTVGQVMLEVIYNEK